MHLWQAVIITLIATSIPWAACVWLLLNRAEKAEWEAMHLRVSRPPRHDLPVRRRLRYGDPVPTEWTGHVTPAGTSAWPPTGTTNWQSGHVTPTKES